MRCADCGFKTLDHEVMNKHRKEECRKKKGERITVKRKSSKNAKGRKKVKLNEKGKSKQTPRHGCQTEIFLGGKCKVEGCGKQCKNLFSHQRYHHSGRSHQCPFCKLTLSGTDKLSDHVQRCHAYKVGVLPGRSAEPPKLNEVMTGNDLLELMRGYGQDVEGALAYEMFGLCYDPENLCHRWVVFEVTQALMEASAKAKKLHPTYKKCPKVIEEQPISFAIRGVGCDHGHAAPRFLYGAHPNAFADSHMFPNISAQLKEFNLEGGKRWEWNERRLAEYNDRVIVVTGPTYKADKDVGWVNAGCGYTHRIPEGFFRFVIIRNRGQPDAYQAFHCLNKGNTEILFVERFTIEDLQKKIGPQWELLPHLRGLSYTWDNENASKFCKVCLTSVPAEKYYKHFESHGFVCRFERCNIAFDNEEEWKVHNATHGKDWLKCKLCCRKFIHQTSLDAHFEEQHAKKQFSCNKCTRVFKSYATFKYHSDFAHTMVRQWYCPMESCEQGFNKPAEMWMHCVAAHSKSKRFFCPKHPCYENDTRFTRKTDLLIHLKKKHPMVAIDDPVIRNQSTAGFVKEWLLEQELTKDDVYNKSKEALKRKQEELARVGPLMFNSTKERQPHPPKKIWYCPLDNCGAKIGTKSALLSHCIGMHSDVRRFYCTDPKCLQKNERFKYRADLHKHYKAEHNMKFADTGEQTTKRFMNEILAERGMTLTELIMKSDEIAKRKNEELMEGEEKQEREEADDGTDDDYGNDAYEDEDGDKEGSDDGDDDGDVYEDGYGDEDECGEI